MGLCLVGLVGSVSFYNVIEFPRTQMSSSNWFLLFYTCSKTLLSNSHGSAGHWWAFVCKHNA